MEIKSWEDYFLDLAKTCASRSNCIRAQVGAVIVGEDKKIKATGYNGTPSKVESCAERGECYRIKHNIQSGNHFFRYFHHASINLLDLQAKARQKATTLPPTLFNGILR